MDEPNQEATDNDSGLREECVVRADDVVELLETLITGLITVSSSIMEVGKFVEDTKNAVQQRIDEHTNNEDHSDPQDT